MFLSVRLIPKLGDPHEVLLDGLSHRHEIEFTKESVPHEGLNVGRGRLTGIADGAVGEAIFSLDFDEICFREQQVRATRLPGVRASIYVNGLPWQDWEGSLYLSHGDSISLDGLRYEYKVHIQSPPGEISVRASSGHQEVPDHPNLTARVSISSFADRNFADHDDSHSCASFPYTFASPPVSPKVHPKKAISFAPTGISLGQSSAKQLAEEVRCSICLDIQVFPCALTPCGHSYCSPCLKNLELCPQCRIPVESYVPARQFESMINVLVNVPDLLDRDDVEHFRERHLNYAKMGNNNSSSTPRKRKRQQQEVLESPRTARPPPSIPMVTPPVPTAAPRTPPVAPPPPPRPVAVQQRGFAPPAPSAAPRTPPVAPPHPSRPAAVQQRGFAPPAPSAAPRTPPVAPPPPPRPAAVQQPGFAPHRMYHRPGWWRTPHPQQHQQHQPQQGLNNRTQPHLRQPPPLAPRSAPGIQHSTYGSRPPPHQQQPRGRSDQEVICID
eukprot:Nitzschia sp. Nitz4//scaffold203_size38902//1212//2795//NITZ4_007654-RA/size38902-augustus-gene-0.42-mRNA-1//1//CDS//3329541406//4718//frame0